MKKNTQVILSLRKDARYVILDAFTKEIINDAQGYGFGSIEKAYRFAESQKGWYVTNPPIYPESESLF